MEVLLCKNQTGLGVTVKVLLMQSLYSVAPIFKQQAFFLLSALPRTYYSSNEWGNTQVGKSMGDIFTGLHLLQSQM